jgi:hypothetical protein
MSHKAHTLRALNACELEVSKACVDPFETHTVDLPDRELSTDPKWAKAISGSPAAQAPRERPITAPYFQWAVEPLPEVICPEFNEKLGKEVLLPGSN